VGDFKLILDGMEDSGVTRLLESFKESSIEEKGCEISYLASPSSVGRPTSYNLKKEYDRANAVFLCFSLTKTIEVTDSETKEVKTVRESKDHITTLETGISTFCRTALRVCGGSDFDRSKIYLVGTMTDAMVDGLSEAEEQKIRETLVEKTKEFRFNPCIFVTNIQESVYKGFKENPEGKIKCVFSSSSSKSLLEIAEADFMRKRITGGLFTSTMDSIESHLKEQKTKEDKSSCCGFWFGLRKSAQQKLKEFQDARDQVEKSGGSQKSLEQLNNVLAERRCGFWVEPKSHRLAREAFPDIFFPSCSR